MRYAFDSPLQQYHLCSSIEFNVSKSSWLIVVVDSSVCQPLVLQMDVVRTEPPHLMRSSKRSVHTESPWPPVHGHLIFKKIAEASLELESLPKLERLADASHIDWLASAAVQGDAIDGAVVLQHVAVNIERPNWRTAVVDVEALHFAPYGALVGRLRRGRGTDNSD